MSAIHPTESATEKPSLLIVDDDEAFLGVLASAMRKRGFAVITANSACLLYTSRCV